jgi:outer membrane lipoprotein SlyB
MTPHSILFVVLCACALVGCSHSDNREYHAPAGRDLKPQSGIIVRFWYPDSPSGAAVTGEFVGSMLLDSLTAPLMIGANNAHVPVFNIRLDDGRIVNVQDADAPPMARGSRVVLMPSGKSYRILPDTRR